MSARPNTRAVENMPGVTRCLPRTDARSHRNAVSGNVDTAIA